MRGDVAALNIGAPSYDILHPRTCKERTHGSETPVKPQSFVCFVMNHKHSLRVHVPKIVLVLGKYMIIRYLDPLGLHI